MTDDQPDRSQIWNLLNYKTLHATASLMYLLQGMEQVRGRILPAYNGYPPDIRHAAVCPPELSYVDVPLVDNGPGFDLSEVLGREGEAEQLAFKAWVEETYNIVWESDLRNAIRASFAANDAIRPEADPLGDLRLIRNDLVHGAGIASAQRTGKCTVLRWFEPGDPMILTMGHVLDFLNHMSLMNLMGGFMSGASARWFVFPQMRSALEERETPEIVSLRTVFFGADDDGTSAHGICIAFDNGVWANTPIRHPANGTPIPDRMAFMEQTLVDDDGNVRLANGTTFDRRDLYLSGIAVMFGDVPQDDMPPLPGPWFQFRE